MEGQYEDAVLTQASKLNGSLPVPDLKLIEELYPGWVSKNTLGNISIATARSIWSNMGSAERETIKELCLRLEKEGCMEIQDVVRIVKNIVGSVCGQYVIADTLSVINRSETGAALLLAKEFLTFHRDSLSESCAKTDLFISGEQVFQVQTDSLNNISTIVEHNRIDERLPNSQGGTISADQPKNLAKVDNIPQPVSASSEFSSSSKQKDPYQRVAHSSKLCNKISDTTPVAKAVKANSNFPSLKNGPPALLGYKEERIERRKKIISNRQQWFVESDHRVAPGAERAVEGPLDPVLSKSNLTSLSSEKNINNDYLAFARLKTDPTLCASTPGTLRKDRCPNMKKKKRSTERVPRQSLKDAQQIDTNLITGSNKIPTYHPLTQSSLEKQEQKLKGSEINPGNECENVGRIQRKPSSSQKKPSKINYSSDRYFKNNISNKRMTIKMSAQQLRSKLSRKRIMLTKKAAELGIPLESVARGNYVSERAQLAVLEKLVLGKIKIKSVSENSEKTDSTTSVKFRNSTSIVQENITEDKIKFMNKSETDCTKTAFKSSISTVQNMVVPCAGNKFSDKMKMADKDANNLDCQLKCVKGLTDLTSVCVSSSNRRKSNCDPVVSKLAFDKNLSRKSSPYHPDTICGLEKALKKASNDSVISDFLKTIAQKQGCSKESPQLTSSSERYIREKQFSKRNSSTSLGRVRESSVSSEITGGVEVSPKTQSKLLIDDHFNERNDSSVIENVEESKGSTSKSDLIDDTVKTIEERLRMSKLKYNEHSKHSSLRKSWTEYNPDRVNLDAVEEDRCGDDSRSNESLEVHPSLSQTFNEKNCSFVEDKIDILDEPQLNCFINSKAASILDSIPAHGFCRSNSNSARSGSEAGEERLVTLVPEGSIGDSPDQRPEFEIEVSEIKRRFGSSKDSSVDGNKRKSDLNPSNSPSRSSFQFFSMSKRCFTFVCLAAGLLSATLIDAIAY